MTDQTIVPDHPSLSEIVRRAVEMYLATPPASEIPQELFHSPRAETLKEEIIAAGRKLWQRQYVDGNGGNISARLSAEYVICTPTMVSKGDLRAEDLSLVDLNNTQIIGDRPQTSEIPLHLEIYKTVPQAQAVIHCHPPYATAHAIAGVAPGGNLLPEQEIFVGPVVVAPYETPGTLAFAQTIVPMVRQHNTILLANHGIVCWADTVTHAEWYTEILETYCKIVMIASRIRSPLPEIPAAKIDELLAIKKRLGLPDARIEPGENSDGGVKSDSSFRNGHGQHGPFRSGEEMERLVTMITREILKFTGPEI